MILHQPRPSLLHHLGATTALIACSMGMSWSADAPAVASPASEAVDGMVKVGPGGYLIAPRKACKQLNDPIYKTSDMTGPMLTGQWWSSLVWQPLSQPLFAHPMTMR